MSIVSDTPDEPTPGNRRFAIVSTADPERVLETFESPGWAPAVLVYAQKLRMGNFAERATLREARESEVSTERKPSP